MRVSPIIVKPSKSPPHDPSLADTVPPPPCRNPQSPTHDGNEAAGLSCLADTSPIRIRSLVLLTPCKPQCLPVMLALASAGCALVAGHLNHLSRYLGPRLGSI